MAGGLHVAATRLRFSPNLAVVALGHLPNAPIQEVVCGVLFEELLGLDPVRVGQLWSENRDRYARHEMHPPIRDAAGFELLQGVGPIRSWLISPDEEYVLQVQSDRLYFNWRRRGGGYPRFEKHEWPGVLDRLLEELAVVRSFCAKELGVSLTLHTVELAKISHIGFDGFDDLVTLVPCLGGLRAVAQSPFPEVSVVLKEESGGVNLRTSLSTIVSSELLPALRCDILARQALAAEGDPREDLRKLNVVLNGTFERIVSKKALERFGANAQS